MSSSPRTSIRFPTPRSPSRSVPTAPRSVAAQLEYMHGLLRDLNGALTNVLAGEPGARLADPGPAFAATAGVMPIPGSTARRSSWATRRARHRSTRRRRASEPSPSAVLAVAAGPGAPGLRPDLGSAAMALDAGSDSSPDRPSGHRRRRAPRGVPARSCATSSCELGGESLASRSRPPARRPRPAATARRDRAARRSACRGRGWWGVPARNTLDRATAMLPASAVRAARRDRPRPRRALPDVRAHPDGARRRRAAPRHRARVQPLLRRGVRGLRGSLAARSR